MGKAAIFGERKVQTLPALTFRQREIFWFAWLFFLENDCLPTRNEIARVFGFRSTNATEEHLQALVRRGFLRPNSLPGRFKFTERARAYVQSNPYQQLAAKPDSAVIPLSPLS